MNEPQNPVRAEIAAVLRDLRKNPAYTSNAARRTMAAALLETRGIKWPTTQEGDE